MLSFASARSEESGSGDETGLSQDHHHLLDCSSSLEGETDSQKSATAEPLTISVNDDDLDCSLSSLGLDFV